MVQPRFAYGEQEQEAAKLLQMHTLFSQDPSLAPMYGLQNKYLMLKSILEQQGILNAEEYLTRLDQLPPPQPDSEKRDAATNGYKAAGVGGTSNSSR